MKGPLQKRSSMYRTSIGLMRGARIALNRLTRAKSSWSYPGQSSSQRPAKQQQTILNGEYSVILQPCRRCVVPVISRVPCCKANTFCWLSRRLVGAGSPN